MRRMVFALSVSLIVLLSVPPAPVAARAVSPPQAGQTRAGQPVPAIAQRTAGMQRMDGFFPLYWDEAAGALYLEIPKLDAEVLFQTGIGAGMGSNDIGLDRGL